MPLTSRGATLSIESQPYDNPVFLPGALKASGASVSAGAVFFIKAILFDQLFAVGSDAISDVFIRLDGQADIPCTLAGDGTYVPSEGVGIEYLNAGRVVYTVSRNILGRTYSNTFVSPLKSQYQIDFLLYADLINGDGFNLDLSNRPLSRYEVNRALYELDSIATSGFVGRVINFSGSEQPGPIAGPYNGLGPRDSLIGKGFTIFI